jgi:hypothetical protein
MQIELSNIEPAQGAGLWQNWRCMGIIDIFSKREMRASGVKGDVFVYDNIPKELRVQIVHIIQDMIGDINTTGSEEWYELIHDALAREYGMHRLTPEDRQLFATRLFTFIQRTETAARVLDVIEVSFATGQEKQRRSGRMTSRPTMYVSEAIRELNQRFMEAGVGYQYEQGQMIRVDSKFAHAEIVKPALVLLSDPRYRGAEEEFLKAHKDYREGDYKGCLAECGNAFESTMKAICEKRNWPYPQTATASTLIDICLKNDLIPSMLQSELNALQTVLGSGVPTMRNKLGSHGQGPVPNLVPSHVAAYALHLTAANIVLLATAEKSLP